MWNLSARGAGFVSALLLSLATSPAAVAQTYGTHADYSQTTVRPPFQQTMGRLFGGRGSAVVAPAVVGYADCNLPCDACDGVCPIPCDSVGCDSLGCDGLGCDGLGCDGLGCDGSGCGGAFCLLGGHETPYDLAIDTFGLYEDSCFDIGGWVQFGYTSRSTGQFNSNPNRLNNHQSWIYMEKVAHGELGFDWGFRLDAMYGTDADDTQAFGNPPGQWDFQNGFDHGSYGFAMPQLYFEMAFSELSVKVGHFYKLLGYEVVPAPDNFFYSHSFTMYNSEAFTHTGALATWQYDPDITLYAGWTEGWDTGFDRFDNGSNFLGGASLRLTEDSSFAYIMTLGDFGKIGDGYSHSLVLDILCGDSLNYIIQSDLLHTTDSTSYGINQYLIYDINTWLAAGARAEWWRKDEVSYYGVTAGLNIRPTGNLIIRPEVRYQYSPSGNDFSGITNTKNPAGLPLDEGAIFGIDAILTF